MVYDPERFLNELDMKDIVFYAAFQQNKIFSRSIHSVSSGS
jgi:hypothetical protein